MGPKMPPEMNAPAVSSYSKSQFDMDVKAYRDAVKIGNLSSAQSLRNQIAYHVMADIESSYCRFEMRITSSRAAQSTVSDATVQGLTAATGLVGSSDVKDILAATSSAFQGSWQSYDKNFFREKTTESIVSQMRASRKTLQAQLITSLGTRDVSSYPWDAVWIDLVDFYYAGTVPSALVEIASGTGTKADAATTTLKKAVAGLTIRTKLQANQAINIRSVYDKFAAAIADPAKSARAIVSLNRILTAIGNPPPDNASAADLLALLKAAMIEAKTDDDKLAKLNDAIAAEKLE
jgi:hypothetical protein